MAEAQAEEHQAESAALHAQIATLTDSTEAAKGRAAALDAELAAIRGHCGEVDSAVQARLQAAQAGEEKEQRKV